jgi:hypothetical protein
VDATRYLAQVEADLLRGSWADPKLGRVTFGGWVEQWRPTTANLRPGTLVLYDYQLRRFLLLERMGHASPTVALRFATSM